jgi:HEAT repeat protein
MILQRLADSLTLASLVAAGAAVAALIVALVVAKRVRDRRRLLLFVQTPLPLRQGEGFSPDQLLRRSGLIERLERTVAPGMVSELHIAPLWVERLMDRGRPADFRRVLNFCPNEGLFACFLLGLRRPRLLDLLISYLDSESPDSRLEALAASSDGRSFDAHHAGLLRERWGAEFESLAVHPEWNVRNFALRVISGSSDHRALGLLFSAIDDPQPENRILSVESIPVESEDRVQRLTAAALDDPVASVRKAAVERLRSTGAWKEAFNFATLSSVQRSHLAPLLDPQDDSETSIALDWLEQGDPEVQLPAARMLSRAGVLERFLQESDFGDRTGLERRRRVLTNALEVRVADFLGVLEYTTRPAVLLLGAQLLMVHGDPDLVRVVAERVFRMQERVVPNYVQLYETATAAVGARGDDAALLLLLRELYARRRPELLRSVLNAIPGGRDTLFAEPLLTALADESFPERQSLRRAILRLDSARVLAACFSILEASPTEAGPQLRTDALYLVSQLDLSYVIRPVLEATGSLPVSTVAGLVQIAHAMAPALTRSVIAELFETGDAPVRAALLSALPEIDSVPFRPVLEAALSDPDPDVRVSAIQALDSLDELKILGDHPGLVRDPVTRVRTAFAEVLAASTAQRDVATLREAVCDNDELEEVRLCLISALAGNSTVHATETLLDLLGTPEPIGGAAAHALARVTNPESLILIAGRHAADTATSVERDSIELAVTAVSRHNEQLLQTTVAEAPEKSLPALSDLLDATGYSAQLLARLRHRDPQSRLQAARALARLHGIHAAAGVVLASWDSDPEVQQAVGQALERLKEVLSEDIRQELHEHPLRRVRKYSDRTFGPLAD